MDGVRLDGVKLLDAPAAALLADALCDPSTSIVELYLYGTDLWAEPLAAVACCSKKL
jgi:hypothetical protein